MKDKGHQVLVSVVIPTHNSGRTIERCLTSITKQSYKKIEIIVVDSKNYDKEEQERCGEIIRKYAAYFQDGPERSIQRNRGIKEAKGEYILMLDQDMYLTPDVVKECVGSLSGYIALVVPEISIGEGYWAKCVALERYVTTFLEYGMNECCRFFRKDDALAIGGYDSSIVGAEDSDFHYRMGEKGKIGKVKNFLYHDEGRVGFASRVKKKYYYSRAFKMYFQRYPKVAVTQFFPIKLAYFKHWKYFLKEPILVPGIISLRIAEVAAGFFGIIKDKGEQNA